MLMIARTISPGKQLTAVNDAQALPGLTFTSPIA